MIMMHDPDKTLHHLSILTFSMLYFSKACVAQSTASCCISSDMSAFLITAFRSAILVKSCHNFWRKKKVGENRPVALKAKL